MVNTVRFVWPNAPVAVKPSVRPRARVVLMDEFMVCFLWFWFLVRARILPARMRCAGMLATGGSRPVARQYEWRGPVWVGCLRVALHAANREGNGKLSTSRRVKTGAQPSRPRRAVL